MHELLNEIGLTSEPLPSSSIYIYITDLPSVGTMYDASGTPTRGSHPRHCAHTYSSRYGPSGADQRNYLDIKGARNPIHTRTFPNNLRASEIWIADMLMDKLPLILPGSLSPSRKDSLLVIRRKQLSREREPTAPLPCSR
jgi:hypothetical protein